GADPSLDEALVEAAIDLRDARDSGKAPVARGVGRHDLSHVAELSRREPQEVVAESEIGVERLRSLFDEFGLIEAGGQAVEEIDVRFEFSVLLPTDTARYENPEMPDTVMERIDDRLVVCDNVRVVAVKVGDPTQRLGRRRNVIAVRAEDQDGRADVPQIDA